MKFKTKPYEHQADEYYKYWNHSARALLWQMRTGKSKAVIDSAAKNFEEGVLDGVLVIAPNGVHENWIRKEFPKHCPLDWVGISWTQKAKRNKSFKEKMLDIVKIIRSRKKLGVVAVNIEAIPQKEAQQLFGSMIANSNIGLVVDESHKFGNPTAKRTKRLLTMVHHFPWRRILSGTATGNSPLKLWSQFEILEPAALGFPKYRNFKHRYADIGTGYGKNNRHFEQIFGYINQDELQSRIAEKSSVVLRSDCEDLPEIIHTERFINMTDSQEKAYATMKKSFLAELDDGDIVEANGVGPKLVKLQQILSNFIVKETGEIVPIDEKKNPRIGALLEIVEEVDEKIIVWCKYREELRQLEEVFGDKAVSYHGGVKGVDRIGSLERFEKDPECRIFLGQPACAGEGLDISVADVIVWYSHSFDVVIREQASERASEVGKDSILMIDFVCPDSIDGYILENLKAKQKISKRLTGKELKKILDSV